MKRFLSGFLQFILLLLTFLVGSIAPALHIIPSLEWPIRPGRVFVYDGLLLMLALYMLFLIIGLVRKRIRTSGVTSTVAMVLALILGLAMKFGFRDS